MSETLWETEVVVETQSDVAVQEAPAEPSALTVSADDFSALEERVRRAVEVVKRERQARTAAEERASAAEAQVQLQSPKVEQLQNELNGLRAEREQVRQRVERLLKQLDELEL